MNKIFLLIIIFLFSNALFSQNNLSPDIERIISKKKIIIAMFKEDTSPFFMKNSDNQFIGIDVDISKDIGKKLEVSVEFNRSASTFEEVVDLVADKKADIAVSMLSSTLKRAKKIRFTEPYVILHQSLLINRLEMAKRKKYDSIATLLNNQSSKIGIVEGTSYVDFLKEDFPLAEHIIYSDWSTMVNDVNRGKILALFYDEIDIQNWQYENPKTGLYLQPIIMKDKPDPIAIGVHWQDVHLHSWLNQYLKITELDGTLNKLRKYYIEGNEWRKNLKTN